MENHGKQLPGYPRLGGKGRYRLDEAKARIAALEEALRPLVAGEAFGLRCNYCREFDSTLGKLHSESCPVVIGRKVLDHE